MGTMCLCFEKYKKQLSKHYFSNMNDIGIYTFSQLLSAAGIQCNRGQMAE
jgi:hypothetical protein